MRSLFLALALVMSTPLVASAAEASQYTAFSFKVARERGGERALGDTGIGRALALVYDSGQDDIILVGKKEPKQQPISADDWAVAVRAVLGIKTDPAVSIDRTGETDTTRKQKVRFEGGLEDTQFGHDLLDADVVLKRLGLGTKSAKVFGLRSYMEFSAEEYRQTRKESKLVSRFWFHPDRRESYVTAKDGVVAVEKYRIGVTNEVLGSVADGAIDRSGERFAANLQSAFEDIKLYFPQLGRMEQLYYVTALAQGLEASGMSRSALVSYWLNAYAVSRVGTPRDYPLEDNTREVADATLELSGGVSLDALVVDLQDGVASAIKRYVLKSRPAGDTLSWDVPMMEFVWETVYAPERVAQLKAEARSDDLGMSIMRDFKPQTGVPASFAGLSGMRLRDGAFSQPSTASFVRPQDFRQKYVPNIGGVMLSGGARLVGAGPAQVEMSGASFSFVVGGRDAKLAPEAFRKFVTALWAVYFERRDPGVSIDPIAPDIDQHLVRYIGRVTNTDLGRVMREADYLMKKWAVGTEKPAIANFHDVDYLMAKVGFRYVDASRRFWFVPTDMEFKRGGDLLLFDKGHMTVRTEYVFLEGKKKKAEPADERFAAFFTDNYAQIAKKYPVYDELFEYAKLVALAKYLKQSGVPLLWFLLANKDLVLTEDSIGTVDALARGSKHFPGLEIHGGVDLKTAGKYVLDAKATAAIDEAIAKMSSNGAAGQSSAPAAKQTQVYVPPSSFDLGKDAYAVIPQHSLTSGRDSRGVLYQTDFALRREGEPGLELVRYFDSRRPDDGEFGNGWRLLVPYQVKALGEAVAKFGETWIPPKMVVLNLLSGTEETLTFNAERYRIAGYVPDDITKSQIIGLFPSSEYDGAYRLADKLGNEFHFDGNGNLTDMSFSFEARDSTSKLISDEHHVHFEYIRAATNTFEKAPYRIELAGEDRIHFAGALVSRRVRIRNLASDSAEVLTFTSQHSIAGYAPEAGQQGNFQFLAVLSDGSFQLLDKAGNETFFTGGGEFRNMRLASARPMVASVAHGSQRINFTYGVDGEGQVRIANAYLFENNNSDTPTFVAKYQYDQKGRLSGVKGPVRYVATNERDDTRVAAR